MGIILILAGIVGIVVGIVGDEFHSGDILSFSGKDPEQRIPTWFGRVIFLLVGVFFIVGGIALVLKAD
jgi:di/tricarboxylate transporter